MRDSAATLSSDAPVGVGERVRALRVAAGLTQTALAGERFSKEYVSQIERGKTRPTDETVAWLAERLGVDPEYLRRGVPSDVRSRVEAKLAQAEALSEAHRDQEAVELFREVRGEIERLGSAELEARALAGEGWSLQELGSPREAIEVLQLARALTERPEFSDLDRADVLFRLGCCRYRISSIPTAINLLDEALELAERSGLPCDVLRARALAWRSRCRRRQADYEAARDDVERALELARGVDDPRSVAGAYFQASFVAEKMGHWALARQYAQQAKAIYQDLNDERNTGRIMLNLGGLQLLLGKPEQAIEQLTASFALAVEAGSQPDAAQALGGLAAVHEHLGDHEAADEHARKALALLEGREDFLDETGQSNLVLGRSLLERGRLDEAEQCFRAADQAFEQMESVAHRTGAWVALGDLAERRGDAREAARWYRNAAEALAVVRF
ncbi:tetratricopeptide repeat protein [Gaiella sp.]|jgi:tetratricopeptide (TPR) repeat protein|uniref:tetratricopeptide repeat protein n=1 Tax=Gaiella sp. TaxID=2663207 RepID=UPI002E2EE241|nr:tetratricopeptide repeat protein [Gaiella sp.]HEX5582591.1 tetratricopeptide repeat protein [Gaiella sp.]